MRGAGTSITGCATAGRSEGVFLLIFRMIKGVVTEGWLQAHPRRRPSIRGGTGAEKIKGLSGHIVMSIRAGVIMNLPGETDKCKPYASRPCMPMRVRVVWVIRRPPEHETRIEARFPGVSQPFPIFIHLNSCAAVTLSLADNESVCSFL